MKRQQKQRDSQNRPRLLLGPALTWEDLADIYDETTNQKARIRPMKEIWDWAEKQKNRFYVDPKEGTIHLIK